MPLLRRSTPRALYTYLRVEDRSEVASQCFQDGYFTKDGELNCTVENHGERKRTVLGLRSPCEVELDCEIMAAFLTMPSPNFDRVLSRCQWISYRDYSVQPSLPGFHMGFRWWPHYENLVAEEFQVEPWAVRFRVVLRKLGF